MPSDAPAARPDPRADRAAPTRKRLLAIAGIAVVFAIAAIALVMSLTGGDNPEPTPPAASTPSPTAAAPSPSPSASAVSAEVAPGEIVIEAGEAGISIYGAPGDDEAVEHLGPWSELGSLTTLMGFAREHVDGEEWIQVELLGAPNHRTGWVRADDGVVTSTDSRIDVYLDEREVDVTVAGEVVAASAAVVGESVSPTPLGVFWVTDVLDFTANPTGVYGAYALGLNGWSETLEEFNGGVPQIAVHGTNQPDLIGEALSNGCIRLPNDVITAIAQTDGVGRGTPVVVHASRGA